MSDFYIKYRDTLPVLRVLLLNPDGTAHDATGSTAWTLHVWLSNGRKLTRTMTLVAASPGELGYDWTTTDWDAYATNGTVGGLYSGPELPGLVKHRMEYEVTGVGGARLTFPNDGYDTLIITPDIGQA